MTISFYGGETTGGVADRTINTARQETTGGVGFKNKQQLCLFDSDTDKDTVCFKGSNDTTSKKKNSALGTIFGVAVGAAAIIAGLGFAHKYDVVGKIKNEKVQKFFRHTDAIAEPCHKACSWIKKNCYDKVVNIFKKSN